MSRARKLLRIYLYHGKKKLMEVNRLHEALSIKDDLEKNDKKIVLICDGQKIDYKNLSFLRNEEYKYYEII